MVGFLIVALLIQLFMASQDQGEGPNIQVLSVSSERAVIPRPSNLEPPFNPVQVSTSNPIRANPRGLPTTSDTIAEQRSSIDQRTRDMNKVEAQANRDRASGPPRDRYSYRIKLRNTGAATIKFIVWDYETIDPASAGTSPPHTFKCSTRIKPNSTAVLNAITHSPPERIINAKSAGGQRDQRGIIDRVEYEDGSVWQRPGWNLADSNQITRPKTSRCLEVH